MTFFPNSSSTAGGNCEHRKGVRMQAQLDQQWNRSKPTPGIPCGGWLFGAPLWRSCHRDRARAPCKPWQLSTLQSILAPCKCFTYQPSPVPARPATPSHSTPSRSPIVHSQPRPLTQRLAHLAGVSMCCCTHLEAKSADTLQLSTGQGGRAGHGVAGKEGAWRGMLGSLSVACDSRVCQHGTSHSLVLGVSIACWGATWVLCSSI